MTSRECVFISAFEHFFFLLATWKYPAETLGRVLLGSQDVNVNFLPVAKETLSLTAALVPSPMVTVLSVKEAFLFPVISLVQSDIEEHLRIRPLRWTGRPQHLGVVLIYCDGWWWLERGGFSLPSELSRTVTFTPGSSSADCYATVWMAWCRSCLSCRGVTQVSTIQCNTPPFSQSFFIQS